MSQPVRRPDGAVLLHFKCRRANLNIEEREAGCGAGLMDTVGKVAAGSHSGLLTCHYSRASCPPLCCIGMCAKARERAQYMSGLRTAGQEDLGHPVNVGLPSSEDFSRLLWLVPEMEALFLGQS